MTVDEAVRERLTEFYASLDMAGSLAITSRAEEAASPQLLITVFGSIDNLFKVAGTFSKMRGKYSSDAELIVMVSKSLEENQDLFLVLSHLHRQLRFTNIELVNMLFEPSRLNDLGYYEELIKSDSKFAEVYAKTIGAKMWRERTGHTDPILHKLASCKKTVSSYLDSENDCWALWKERIRSDASVRKQIAEFVVRNEDLGQLIRDGLIEPAMQRSLRTVNVESVKQELGGHASTRVRRILDNHRFVSYDYGTKNFDELRSILRSLKSGLPEYGYTSEVTWKKVDKKFDFVLIRRDEIKYVMELNYFTTSMSKIREVVGHYKDLREKVLPYVPFIYITDGVGWFNLAKSLEEMFALESGKGGKSLPFLMNLGLFDMKLEALKASM